MRLFCNFDRITLNTSMRFVTVYTVCTYIPLKHCVEVLVYFCRDKVVVSLSTIHGHVLRECHQIPWAGDDHLLTRTESPPEEPSASEPRSLSILLEKINLKHQDNGGSNIIGDVFVGPTTYIQFMHCFRHIFRDKRKEANERVDQLT